MSRKIGKFELPKRLSKVEKGATDTYAKFIAEPFESGFGATLGNSFRRILMSSIEGAAITSALIEGTKHEFHHAKEGILEDPTDIILNLKKILVKTSTRDPITLHIDVTKEGEIKASDIQAHEGVEILNPEQLICTLNKKQNFKLELEVRVGRGFCLAEDNKPAEQEIGRIPLDSLFSPVQLVRYSVENTRVGKMTNYDKLTLEVWTDGRITPSDAITEALAIFHHHLTVFSDVVSDEIEFEKQEKIVSEEQNRLRQLLNMSVNEMELSVRAANCLDKANMVTVGQLCMLTEAEMLKYRNFGKKSLNEIKERLSQLGLSLGMKIDDRLLEN